MSNPTADEGALPAPLHDQDFTTRLPGYPDHCTSPFRLGGPATVMPRAGRPGYDYTTLEGLMHDTPYQDSLYQPICPNGMYKYANGWVSYPYGIPADLAPVMRKAASKNTMVSSIIPQMSTFGTWEMKATEASLSSELSVTPEAPKPAPVEFDPTSDKVTVSVSAGEPVTPIHLPPLVLEPERPRFGKFRWFA
ncbi:MAG: uncharacterized protein KVP18_001360 [Porospora cf. gigantea A]|uniref:uncharacterized protein n=2 Tax=Porospora cf. gigantea A TaxID=2853593 RepID=UPI00355A2A08|nr:MAG: hypothetical protein KVP18_001360 [Porospora cf. gigantea A]